jgi:predicted ATPase
MLLMRLSRGSKNKWDSLHDDLVGFGRESGLFTDIRVKRHGRQMSDPFQLQVKVRTGPHANVLDVGYGVSRSLPILVDVMTAPESDGKKHGRGGDGRDGRSFLIQQPEVHLHPRGQAELANVFIEAFRKRGHRFLIETHSDYIVDRVRISVRKGSLKPDDVSILYFEPTGNAVTIHNLTLDEHGNLRDAPAGYRDFFVKETDRLPGFAD